MTLGLFAGQALPIMAAGKCEAPRVCGNCCGSAGAVCCEKTPGPERSVPSRIAHSAVDLKQAVVPVLICLGIQPGMVLPQPSVQERAFAQRPVQRRLDLTCIRLV